MPALFTASPPAEMIQVKEKEEEGVIVPEKPNFDKDDVTGSISKKPPIIIDNLNFKPKALSNDDWQNFRVKLDEAYLAKRFDDETLWKNPLNGVSGTISLLKKSSPTCTMFLASAIVEKKDHWFEGNLCQAKGKEVKISSLKEWRR